MLKKSGQIIVVIVGAVVTLAVVALIVCSLVYTPEYVRRVFAWRETDINDYRYNFPARSLAAAPGPFLFDVALEEEKVARQFVIC